jgi:excisionase family DNA binding protein
MPKNASQSNNDKPDQPCFYTVKETARHLRLCQKQIRRLIDRGELPAHRFGTEAIDEYAETRRVHPSMENNHE